MIPEIFSLMDRGWVFQIIPKNNYAINDNNIRCIATASALSVDGCYTTEGGFLWNKKCTMIASCKP